MHTSSGRCFHLLRQNERQNEAELPPGSSISTTTSQCNPKIRYICLLPRCASTNPTRTAVFTLRGGSPDIQQHRGHSSTLPLESSRIKRRCSFERQLYYSVDDTKRFESFRKSVQSVRDLRDFLVDTAEKRPPTSNPT